MRWGKTVLTAFLAILILGGGYAYWANLTLEDPPRLQPGDEQEEQEERREPPADMQRVDEISRHPIELPDSPNYAVFKDGRYEEPVERDGPMTHEIHFTIREVVAEVVSGTTLTLWTFDGTVPGPMVRARVGDTIDFYLHNPEDSHMPHNVDFHAVTGPGGGSVSLDTKPGATSRLRVKLLDPGIYTYHCAFPDVPTHIAHGMYGMIVVEPEEGLSPVDHEFYLMQSEYFTERGGDESYHLLEDQGHLEYSGEQGNLEEPTFVVFNGRPNSFTGDRTLGIFGDGTIQVGDTARLFVGNIGPGLISSFHVIGEIFDRVYVEGSFSLFNRNVQTTLVPAGGAAGVEITFEVPGTYITVDHSIFRTHKGAHGEIKVQGPSNPEVYDPVENQSDETRPADEGEEVDDAQEDDTQDAADDAGDGEDGGAAEGEPAGEDDAGQEE